MNEGCIEALEELDAALEEYLETEEYSLEEEELDCYPPVVGDHPVRLAVTEIEECCCGGKPLPRKTKRAWKDFLDWTRFIIVEDDEAACAVREKNWEQRVSVEVVTDYDARIRRKQERSRMIEAFGSELQEWAKSACKKQVPLLEQVLNVLTPQQGQIFEHLWSCETASYKKLAQIPEAWRDVPSDEAIEKALKRIRQRLDKHCKFGLTLTISPVKRRVTLDSLRGKRKDR